MAACSPSGCGHPTSARAGKTKDHSSLCDHSASSAAGGVRWPYAFCRKSGMATPAADRSYDLEWLDLQTKETGVDFPGMVQTLVQLEEEY